MHAHGDSEEDDGDKMEGEGVSEQADMDSPPVQDTDDEPPRRSLRLRRDGSANDDTAGKNAGASSALSTPRTSGERLQRKVTLTKVSGLMPASLKVGVCVWTFLLAFFLPLVAPCTRGQGTESVRSDVHISMKPALMSCLSPRTCCAVISLNHH